MTPTFALLQLLALSQPAPKPQPTADAKPAVQPLPKPCMSRAGCKWEGEPDKTRVAKKPAP